MKFVFSTALFFIASASLLASNPIDFKERSYPSNAIPFDNWPLDMLVSRENELRAKVQADSRAITSADSLEIKYQLDQIKFYNRSSAICTFTGKFIVMGTSCAAGLITALNWPTYLIYITSGVGGVGVALIQYGEKNKDSSHDIEKEVIAKHSDDVVEYQKIHEARKRKEKEQVDQEKKEMAEMVKTMYQHFTGARESAPVDEDSDVDDMERGMLPITEKGKEEALPKSPVAKSPKRSGYVRVLKKPQPPVEKKTADNPK
ncbi:MAG: hypothetical protein KBB83_01635 [Alphaproteobacteria bacterium]|nr:hypothetical protein [Alphaproteobacteria bacterium]